MDTGWERRWSVRDAMEAETSVDQPRHGPILTLARPLRLWMSYFGASNKIPGSEGKFQLHSWRRSDRRPNFRLSSPRDICASEPKWKANTKNDWQSLSLKVTAIGMTRSHLI